MGAVVINCVLHYSQKSQSNKSGSNVTSEKKDKTATQGASSTTSNSKIRTLKTIQIESILDKLHGEPPS